MSELQLFPTAPSRQIDAETVAAGRRGIATARLVLAAHRPDDLTTYRRHTEAREALARTHTRITTGRTLP